MHGLAGGLSLWLLDAPPQARVDLTIRRHGGHYACVQIGLTEGHQLVAAPAQPHWAARPAPDTLDRTRLDGRRAVVGWLLSAAQHLLSLAKPAASVARTRHCPVSTSQGWRLSSREQGNVEEK